MTETRSKLEQDITSGRVRIGPHGEPYTVTTWATIDLEPVKRGERAETGPEFMPRTDGKALIYRGRPHVFYGPSESLKSWVALLACKSVVDASESALYIDFEADEQTFVERARIVGIPDHAIGRRVRYIRPEEPLLGNASALADLLTEEADLAPSLVILDGVTEAYALHGWNINDATDAAHFQKLFGSFADGTATIAIDHAGKDATRGVVGSQHKRAGLNGAEYEFIPVDREGRGGHSTSMIRVTKDRHGFVRAFAPKGYIGSVHVAKSVWIEAPPFPDEPGRDETLSKAVVDYVTANPGLSTNKIEKAVVGNARTIRESLTYLAVLKRLRTGPGPRGAKLWYPMPDSEPTYADVVDGIVDRARNEGRLTEPTSSDLV